LTEIDWSLFFVPCFPLLGLFFTPFFLIFADSGRKMEKLFLFSNSCVWAGCCWWQQEVENLNRRNLFWRRKKILIYHRYFSSHTHSTMFDKEQKFSFYGECDRCQVILIADALFKLLIWLLFTFLYDLFADLSRYIFDDVSQMGNKNASNIFLRFINF
jgi:hypothetical protein